jgi:2-polyprenyl-3-methyl-5-hydroxy-6-metoxy-1,4-benzoquinol methylase
MTRNQALEFHPELYDATAPGYYDLVYRRGRGVQWFWHFARFREVAKRLPDSIQRIIDLGCGPGTFLGNLERPLDRAVGIDLASRQIGYAREHYGRPGLELRVGDTTMLDPAQDRFDAAVSIEVVEHLLAGDTQTLLASMRDLLVPGGTMVLVTPNYRSHWRFLEPLVSILGPIDYRKQHINRFHRKRLIREVEQAGFVDVRCEMFFVIAPFLAAISKQLAEFVLRFEKLALPFFGAELIVVARNPSP